MSSESKEPNRLTDRQVHTIVAALRDFGCRDLTDDRVRELSDDLLSGVIPCPFTAGETPKGGVITRFIAGQLSEADWLPAKE
jgi:hypothetical protein